MTRRIKTGSQPPAGKGRRLELLPPVAGMLRGGRRGAFLERDRSGEQLVVVGFAESFWAGLHDQRGDGLSVGDFADFARRLNAEQFQRTGGHSSQADDDDRAEYLHEQQQRRGRASSRRVQVRSGEILRHHFAEHHVDTKVRAIASASG